MGRKAKCRICGTGLDTTTAYKVITHDTNDKAKIAYYCSKEEYDKDEIEKRKAAVNKDKVYRLICNIIGRKEILNSVLWKEKKIWNQVADDETIGQYLETNQTYLTNAIARLEDKEFNRIRYLSAIIKNSIGDFKPKEIVKKEEKPKVQVDENFYEVSHKANNKRRSLDELEDEY